MPEKSNKKVSRACNTCRLKRKKCDGLDPCFFCTENKLECSYSREPRRRGPPSGYLRYTETRVTLLETLLGLHIFNHPHHTADVFLRDAENLREESKTCTQDVWDAHKSKWLASASAKIVEELAMIFSPFHRAEQEHVGKPLLPTIARENSSLPSLRISKSSSPPAQSTSDSMLWPRPPSPINTPPRTPQSSVTFLPQPQPHHIMSRESFERTQDPSFLPSPEQLTRAQHHTPSGTQSWTTTFEHGEFSNIGFPGPFEGESSKSDSMQTLLQPSSSQVGFNHDNSQISAGVSMTDAPRENVVNMFSNTGNSDGAYTGSYWRTADLAQSDLSASPIPGLFNVPISNAVELPPAHVLNNLIDVYYQYVYPSFPFLPPRPTLDAKFKGPSTSLDHDDLNTMLLALCAYTERLSPTLEHATGGVPGQAGKVAADLWYEQARTAIGAGIRRGGSVETVQTLLLLALRDHGRGYESQAWLLVGLAVRMGQDLGLDEKGKSPNGKNLTVEDRQTRQDIWGCSLVLDLFLSLQLGHPPAVVDPLRPISNVNYANWKGDTLASSLVPEIVPPLNPLFSQTVALCEIISRVNFHFYLGFSPPEKDSRSDKLAALKAELDAWHHSLPHEYRISIGHQPAREVLEVNMLYHVAIILLYRPFSKKTSMHQAAAHQAANIFLEAASTFNVLLEKYQNHPSTPSPLHLPYPSLSLSNPNMIYLIFTASIAHLSGFKLRQTQQSHHQSLLHGRSTTMALQTQLHLLNCLEALASIGSTWELARRCWRTLDKLMELEGIKPTPSSLSKPQGRTEDTNLGKRKRDGEVSNKTSASVEAQTHLVFLGDHFNSSRPSVGTSDPESGGFVGQFSEGAHPPLENWSSGANNDASTSLSAMSILTSPEVFDPSIFSSARWLREVPETEPGLGVVWNGDWDDSFWTQNFNAGFGGGE